MELCWVTWTKLKAVIQSCTHERHVLIFFKVLDARPAFLSPEKELNGCKVTYYYAGNVRLYNNY